MQLLVNIFSLFSPQNFVAQTAYQHADGHNPDRLLTIVTASVDRVDVLAKLRSDQDVLLTCNISERAPKISLFDFLLYTYIVTSYVMYHVCSYW